MGGGGGNPAGGMTEGFGNAVAKTGTGLTDWFGQLKGEDMRAMTQLNPFIETMINNAFDPQKELYGRTLQQVTDQTRSGEAARGVANTPYGAAAEGNALSNFNIDWQNNSLQREMAGLQSATGTYSGLINAGAAAAQPAEAAMQGYANAFNTSSEAKTKENAQKQQAQQSLFGDISSLAGTAAGGLMNKGGGGG